MRICMVGAGYVGLVSGSCFADLGNSVWCVDKDKKKIDMLNRGQIPIFEPGLKDLINKNAKILPITDKRMTRFIITLVYGVKFVLESFKDSIGGEIFIPKLPSVKIVDIVEAMIGKSVLNLL